MVKPPAANHSQSCQPYSSETILKLSVLLQARYPTKPRRRAVKRSDRSRFIVQVLKAFTGSEGSHVRGKLGGVAESQVRCGVAARDCGGRGRNDLAWSTGKRQRRGEGGIAAAVGRHGCIAKVELSLTMAA